MKLVAGHKYLKGGDGHILPYSEIMQKVSGFDVYIPRETTVSGTQFSANEKLQSANERVTIATKEPVKIVPVVKKMVHHDIRDEMKQDLLEE